MNDKSSIMTHKIINAVTFQALWFTAILSGWLYALPLLFVHLGHFLYAERRAKVRLACIALAALGMMADSIFGVFGIYQFNAGNVMVMELIPLWLCYMWLGFVTCLPISLSWLLRSPVVLLAFFSIGGALSYIAGRKLGALDFPDSSIPFIAGLWFVVASVVLLAIKQQQRQGSLGLCLQSD
ncbi:hypothetical protein A3742_00150 [Oleiphilus sp. HI0071]|uniref:DUF2878 domain-containing protein n=3 Tax=unclassified Oleiphilus TaxID=2631174 RepID=UPI0007C314EF|nr:DUF2878 domain-containing protein [Oleiphilus sp. HI0079]KZY74515.1 hypothetical protein A3737_08080 [Oleiphilus sp. HI0065]KZY89201.1 hypothetical protein A3744_06525 [Oleiphilus sp. HI0073]KZY90180.1 hypothetical protein A3742_24025 [Oleiphilus sp. HI0071]KZZ17715.1 hypothetical protein A3751_10670 [Oleiphilus sp. HI0080]KZZ51300.1 hypothetical protein A3760_01845 [Oleiphilus sp. HI0122]KZZ52476.1 hypothetical protein A3758_10790 [Oleiphilus sp. HI0118]KZZ81487.1 hypothetical protein A3